MSSSPEEPGEGYGAVAARSEGAAPAGRRAAVCIGALLAACVFLALSADGAPGIPTAAVLFGGDWSGSFTAAPVGIKVYTSVDEARDSADSAQPAFDKTLASNAGADTSIGHGEGISGRWASQFDQPALPSTGDDDHAVYCSVPGSVLEANFVYLEEGYRLQYWNSKQHGVALG